MTVQSTAEVAASGLRSPASGDAAHTPGPWDLTADPYDDGTPYFRIKAGDPYSDDQSWMGFHIDAIMREPDARLIAAAPDLLKALEIIRDAFWRDGETYAEMLADMKTIAREALAKLGA
jgi:hypothetical protein